MELRAVERSVEVPEERVVQLEFYEDSASYEGSRSPASPEELSEAIRGMSKANLYASLFINIGGDPEEVGYPVIPWLAVSASRGLLAVETQLGWDEFYYLVGDASAKGKVSFSHGGDVEVPVSRRFMVSVEQAEAAALEFFRTATVDVEGGSWERPSSGWSSQR